MGQTSATLETGRAEHCAAAAAAFAAHGASDLAALVERLATDPLADGLVEEWEPTTPLLIAHGGLEALRDAGGLFSRLAQRQTL